MRLGGVEREGIDWNLKHIVKRRKIFCKIVLWRRGEISKD